MGCRPAFASATGVWHAYHPCIRSRGSKESSAARLPRQRARRFYVVSPVVSRVKSPAPRAPPTHDEKRVSAGGSGPRVSEQVGNASGTRCEITTVNAGLTHAGVGTRRASNQVECNPWKTLLTLAVSVIPSGLGCANAAFAKGQSSPDFAFIPAVTTGAGEAAKAVYLAAAGGSLPAVAGAVSTGTSSTVSGTIAGAESVAQAAAAQAAAVETAASGAAAAGAAAAGAVADTVAGSGGDAGDALARGLATYVLFLIATITIGAVGITYQNWVLMKNDKEARAEVAARIAQFGGEEKIEVEDEIFATDKKGGKKFRPESVLAGGKGLDGKGTPAPGIASPQPGGASMGEEPGNRSMRRRSKFEKRRQKKAEARTAKLKESRVKKDDKET